MNEMNPGLGISLLFIALFAGLSVTRAQTGASADPVTTTSDGEKLSELKVRVYGNTAVASYKDIYDILIMGERRAHTITATDTFVRMGGERKQVASHGSEVK